MSVQKIVEAQAVPWVTAHRSVFAVCMTLVVLEFFQHLELERTLVWTSKWTLCKCLFLISRYLLFGIVATWLYYIAAPNNPSVEVRVHRHPVWRLLTSDLQTCRILFCTGGILITIACLCADAVLYIRVYALSLQSKAIKTVLIAHYVVVSLASLVGMAMFLNSRPAGPTIHLSGLAVCVSVPSPASDRWAIIQYGLLLYSAAFTMLLSLWYGARLFWSVQPTPPAFMLVRIFYADGAFYCAAITAISTANILVSIHAPRQYHLILVIPQTVIHGILATRMILHLREVARVRLVEPNASFAFGGGGAASESSAWGFSGTLSGFKAASVFEREGGQ
ncbi:hypothetical protein BKA70DRAFT_824249 [Coprinopsis sp. MPI-PUGE-AT-0042]|nr:hypothetical protein BKA70DRAFT_824249 [Coprinopsis sp. MPI-PUGE-AT-0042]